MRRLVLLGTLLACLSAWAPPANAAFHFMKIVEVFPGTPAAPTAQYLVLQLYAINQVFVSGHEIRVFDAAGSQVGAFPFTSNLVSGANQAKVLVGTTSAFFGVTPDLSAVLNLPVAGGKVCFDAINVDCIAWGNYTGSSVGVGTPFNASGGGLLPGQAAIRRLNISGSPTALDALDDTGDSANDFVFGLPAPKNNAGATGSVPPSTCGNTLLEGLELCDDGDTNSGDGCSATCQTEIPKEASPAGDMTAANAGGGLVDLTFAPACGASDHAAYLGTGPIAGALVWTGSACALGTSGAASFVLPDPAPDGLAYFVVVGHGATSEGSYGADGNAVERPQASGVGGCDRPQTLSGSCP